MDIASLEAALITAIQTASGLASSALTVSWEHKPQQWGSVSRAYLDLVGFQRIGMDEKRSTEIGDQLQQRRVGQRRLIIQVKVETEGQTLADHPALIMDRIQTGLFREDIRGDLYLIGFAVQDVRPVGVMSYQTANGRSRPVAVLELLFNTSTSVDGLLVDWIAAVTYENEIQDVDGSVVLSETVTIGTPDP